MLDKHLIQRIQYVQIIFASSSVNSFFAVPFLTFNCPIHITNASSRFSCFTRFTLFILALARFYHCFFSLSIPPIHFQLIGLTHNEEKWLAVFSWSWSLEMQTSFLSLRLNTTLVSSYHLNARFLYSITIYLPPAQYSVRSTDH